MATASQAAAFSEAMEYQSPYHVYRRLIQVVTNESIAPEVLPYEKDIANEIVEQVQHMKDNLQRLKPKLDRFCVEQHQLELERINFVLRKYYRTRLEKIERNASELVKQLNEPNGKEAMMNLLSPAELKYLDRYVTSIEGHLDKTVLSKVPINMRSFHLSDIASNAKTEFDCNYVFVKAVVETSVTVDDPIVGQEVVAMEKGSQHFLPYSAVRDHLMQGSKDLILL